MTDLVQKIADSVTAAWHEWSNDPHDTRPFSAMQAEAIRQALADAGGAVAWAHVATICDKDVIQYPIYLSEESAKRDLGMYIEGSKIRIEPLTFAHPDPGWIAELERVRAEQLAKIGDLLRRNAALEQQLTASREREGRMREALELVRDYILTMKGRGHHYQIAVDAALAADKEKNDGNE